MGSARGCAFGKVVAPSTGDVLVDVDGRPIDFPIPALYDTKIEAGVDLNGIIFDP